MDEKFVDYLDFVKYKKRLQEFIKYAVSIPLEIFEKDFLKTYIKKLDIYSLSMLLIEMIYVTQIDGTFKIKNNKLYDSFIKNILVYMVNPDPRYRFTADETYIHLNCLYRNEKIKVKEGDILNFLDIKILKTIVNKMELTTSKDKKELYNTIVKNANLLIK